MAAALLWRPIFLGEVFAPLRQLDYLAPWSAAADPARRVQWNPLQYDSVGQYRVFREYASRSVLEGRLPLWNPYQLCGTPLAANNLSAVYYPFNLLHLWLGTDRGALVFAFLHLVLAALFMRGFLLRLERSQPAAMLGGLIFSFALWHVCWLQLPPFSATYTWLPALCSLILDLRRRPSTTRAGALAATVALVLLAGHLQIAFYVLLTGLAFATVLWVRLEHRREYALTVAAALCLGALLAAPQLLPTVEFSGMAHRAGAATWEGFRAYSAYAAHPLALATLLLPDGFGNPALPDLPYVGFSRGRMYYNYAEGAMYVGLLPLLLAALGAARAPKCRALLFPLALIAAASLLGFGTPVGAVLYFGIPGFAGSGSPARIFALLPFGAAWLASFGIDALVADEIRARRRWATTLLLLGSLSAVAVVASAVSGNSVYWTADVPRQAALGALALLCVHGLLPQAEYRQRGLLLATALIAADLVSRGVPYVASAPKAEQDPARELAETVATLAGHDRIAPINTNWRFSGPEAVLPPNFATMFGLRDVQGYDSLLPRSYKVWLRDTLGEDPSPPEVGNMALLKRPAEKVLDAAGVRLVLSLEPLELQASEQRQVGGVWLGWRPGAPGRVRVASHSGSDSWQWLEDSPQRVRLRVRLAGGGRLFLSDQHWPGWQARLDGRAVPIGRWRGVFRVIVLPGGEHVVEFRYEPASTLVGIYATCCGVLVLAALVARAALMRRVTEGE